MATIQTVQTKGIYHNLPTYPEELKGLTAIITGANGISGFHLLKVLAESPQRWSKIYCLSRRPPAIPGGVPANAEHIACDFLGEPDEIADVLKERGVTADYVFFFSYIQPSPKDGQGIWDDAEELVRVNTRLLKNFLSGLEQAHITPQRILLQTGAKNYGIHMGPIAQPARETAPRVDALPNFYYAQEDLLWAYCAQHGIQWTITMPANVLGAVPDAAMNYAYPLAIYAAVTAHMRRILVFPGAREGWGGVTMHSSAKLNGYLGEWAVLTGAAANQKLNAVDGSLFSNEVFWPVLAGWYGVEWSAPALGDESALRVVEYGLESPPRGYGSRGVMRSLFSFAGWAKAPEVRRAWKEIATVHGLANADLADADRIFGFLDATLCMGIIMSTDKARKMGWSGFVDSVECLREVFEQLAELRMIPPVPKTHVSIS